MESKVIWINHLLFGAVLVYSRGRTKEGQIFGGMGSLLGERIESYEKIMSVYRFYQMWREGNILFPKMPLLQRQKIQEKLSEILEAILLGMVLPADYASEQQNGSLLVFDVSDRLYYLMEFLDGNYSAGKMNIYKKIGGHTIEQLEREFPRVTSLVYDSRISLQIIEYTTPKYMHLLAGNYIEKWSFTREQAVRSVLYGKQMEIPLADLADLVQRYGDFCSKQELNCQYMVLRILMYFFICAGEIIETPKSCMGLPYLLEQTAEELAVKSMYKPWWHNMLKMMEEATNILARLDRDGRLGLAREQGKEMQAKRLGYFYNVIWLCKDMRCDVFKGIEQIETDLKLWKKICQDDVNIKNITDHFDKIIERLQRIC